MTAENISIVYNGVNIDAFQVCEPDAEYRKAWKLSGKKVIGFIGSFYQYEGLDLLIDAVAQLTKTRPDIVLLLVGDGPFKAALVAQVERLRLSESVVMPGSLPHDRIPGIYALIDILAYPRHPIRLTELVTPLKPLEAMAMGKALIASDIGGHRELIRDGHNGILFPAGSVSALANALEHLLEDRDLCRRLTTQAMAWVSQEHSWAKTTTIYSHIYSRALGRSHTLA
jgi:glycosyltransferase involved in cell wall biosynthesis